MTKKDLAEKIQVRTGMAKKESNEAIEAVFSIIKNTLESGENLKIPGFGNFVVKQKNDRRGRNPQTGESIIIGARRILTFKLSNLLRDAINK
jgi:integration host factor subunit alpha